MAGRSRTRPSSPSVQAVHAYPTAPRTGALFESIDRFESDTIDGHELDTMGFAPTTNERDCLCHRLRRNVDPDKDILVSGDLPLHDGTCVDLTLGGANGTPERLGQLYIS